MGGRGTSGSSLPKAAQATLAGRLRDAVTALGGDESGDYVSLAKIRDRLSDVPRAELDAELLRLLDADLILITPITLGADITAADKAAAISVGGKWKHRIKFRD
jgi:hypothetical protein